MKVDFYFSYRSPYSYFILPRLKKLEEEYKVQVNFKLVYPLAIREPHFFKRVANEFHGCKRPTPTLRRRAPARGFLSRCHQPRETAAELQARARGAWALDHAPMGRLRPRVSVNAPIPRWGRTQQKKLLCCTLVGWTFLI